MRAYGEVMDAAHEQSEALRKTGHTIMFLAVDGRLAGILAVGDRLKEQHAFSPSGAEGARLAARDADR